MLGRAVFVMLCLLAAAGAIARASAVEPVVLRAPLDDLPLTLTGWRGVDAGRFDQRTLQILGADDYLNRAYRATAAPPVFLYVGFYKSQRHGDTMHSPLNCLPGAGWQPIARDRFSIVVKDRANGPSRTVHVNDLIIQRGEDQQVVLYWYQSRGRVVPSEYTSKVWTVIDALRLNRSDGAMVRITTPIAGDAAAAHRRAVEFTQALFPELHRHLPE
jgi:EpsI family protein